MPADDLLDAIRADPDDDAPRLVWADREGGERGELVVLQIALDRADLSREDRHRMRARERELLARHGNAWAGLDGLAEATFRRGFVERIAVKLPVFAAEAGAIFARAPLVAEIDLRETSGAVMRHSGPTADEAWGTLAASLASALAGLDPAHRIRFVSASPVVYESGDDADAGVAHRYGDAFVGLVARLPALAGLRSLTVYDGGVSRAAFADLAKLDRLERLQIASALDATETRELLGRMPALRRLALWDAEPRLVGEALGRFLEAPELERLVELELHSCGLRDPDVEALAGCPRLAGLRRLGLGFMRAGAPGIVALGNSPFLANLEELELIGAPLGDSEVAMLSGATFAPRLRRLGVAYASITPKIARVLTIAFPALEELDVSQCAKLAPALPELAARIPEVRPPPGSWGGAAKNDVA